MPKWSSDSTDPIFILKTVKPTTRFFIDWESNSIQVLSFEDFDWNLIGEVSFPAYERNLSLKLAVDLAKLVPLEEYKLDRIRTIKELREWFPIQFQAQYGVKIVFFSSTEAAKAIRILEAAEISFERA